MILGDNFFGALLCRYCSDVMVLCWLSRFDLRAFANNPLILLFCCSFEINLCPLILLFEILQTN